MLKKITNLILLGYCTPLIFMIGVGFVVYLTTQKLSESQKAIQQEYKGVRLAEELTYGVSKMARSIRDYAILFNDSETRYSYKENYDSGYESFRQKALELRESVSDPNQKRAIELLISEGEDQHQIAVQIFQLFDEKRETEAIQMLNSVRFSAYEKAREDFLNRSDYLLTQKNQALENAQQILLLTIVLSTLLAIVGTIITAIAITVPLKKELPIAIEATEQIAQGDLTQNIEFADDGSEIGQLLISFQIMTQKLNSLIRQVQESGIQVTTSVSAIVASSKELEATVTQQSSTTNKVASTAKQIAAASSQLMTTINQVESKSQTTANAAVESQTDLIQMEKSIVKLVDATNLISEKLGGIGEKANNINDIITTIIKVADQTNLLSLNAAIEAEKAGEYGKGFSVVAREISRLADRTAVATLDIENTIQDMQGAVSIGVKEMDSFTQQVKQIFEVVSTISPKLESIICEVQSLTPQFKQVSENMELQSQEASQISDAMVELSESSSQIVEVLRYINDGMAKLDDSTQIMQQEISRFKVDRM